MARSGTIKHWMEHATSTDRSEFAALCGTSEAYALGQLGGGHRENPKIRLALAIVMAAEVMHRKTQGRLPLITLEGVAYPKGRA